MLFFRFLSYHNAVPIAISLMLVGGASVFAATNPEAIYSAQERVLSVDNTYLVTKDLSAYSPKIVITGVTEDSEYYYVAYQFSTIDVKDYVWRDVTRDEIMRVSKAELGPYRDLGLYVTMQFKQTIDNEMDRLIATQKNEMNNISHKVVSTEYGGLIGRFLTSTTEELPGYTPVVQPPVPSTQAAAVASASSGALSEEISQDSSSVSQPTQIAQGSSQNGPIQMLGNNPARIPVGTMYVDLGAVVSNTRGTGSIDIITYLDGKRVDTITLDTSKEGTHTVRYEYVDLLSNVTYAAERQVIVYNPYAQAPVANADVTASTSTSAQ